MNHGLLDEADDEDLHDGVVGYVGAAIVLKKEAKSNMIAPCTVRVDSDDSDKMTDCVFGETTKLPCTPGAIIATRGQLNTDTAPVFGDWMVDAVKEIAPMFDACGMTMADITLRMFELTTEVE